MIFYLVGLTSWTFLEYFMHRFVLHYFSEGHTHHHLNPKDNSQPFIPVTLSAAVSIIYCGALLLFLPGLSVMLLYLGLITGYIGYEYVHYTVHYRPCNNRLLRYLKKHHAKHHHLDDSKYYSVTLPILDKVFGTG